VCSGIDIKNLILDKKMEELNQQSSGPQVPGGSSQRQPSGQPFENIPQPTGKILHQEVVEQPAPSQNVQSSSETQGVQSSQMKYAGFWIRLAAIIIDGFILIIPILIVGFVSGMSMALIGMSESDVEKISSSFLPSVIGAMLVWVYYVFMTYKYGATLGKKAVGVRVVSEKSEKLSIGQVIAREILGRIISGGVTLGIGYLMAAFTKRKRGLHDMVASTVVVHKDSEKRFPIWAVVLIIVAFFIVIIGILSSIVLTSLSVARDKASDAANKALVSGIMADAIEFEIKTGSLEGYSVPENIQTYKCSGDPVVSISPDGRMLAAFVKSCDIGETYFCMDTTGVKIHEVDVEHAQSGKHYCSETEPEIKEESVNIIEDDSIDALGLSLDVSRDLEMLDIARSSAESWQSDAKLHRITMAAVAGMNNMKIIFKSGSKPGKMLEVILKPNGDVYELNEKNDTMADSKWLEVSKMKFSSSEAFKKGSEMLSKIGNDLDEKHIPIIALEYQNDEAVIWVIYSSHIDTGIMERLVSIDSTEGNVSIILQQK
jgi:uncharacterized RDD family membrane protein YckC